MIAMLAKLFERMSVDNVKILMSIVAVVGLIVLISLFVLGMKEKISIWWAVIGFFILLALLNGFAKISLCKSIDETNEAYHTCVKDGYTVYLDGEEVSHPDKMILDGYKVEFNDEDKEILLHKSGE